MILEVAAAAGTALLAVGVAVLAGLLVALLLSSSDTTTWTAGQLGKPPHVGRHRIDPATVRCAADLIAVDHGHIPCHDELAVPPSVPALMIADVVKRARALTVELANAAWRPVAPPTRRIRRAQLEIARRMRAAGQRTAATVGPLGRLA